MGFSIINLGLYAKAYSYTEKFEKKDEFIEKLNRGRADNGTHRDISDFNDNNFNEIEDLTAMNFLYDNNNLLNT